MQMQIVNAHKKIMQEKLESQRNEFERKLKELEEQVAHNDLEHFRQVASE